MLGGRDRSAETTRADLEHALEFLDRALQDVAVAAELAVDRTPLDSALQEIGEEIGRISTRLERWLARAGAAQKRREEG